MFAGKAASLKAAAEDEELDGTRAWKAAGWSAADDGDEDEEEGEEGEDEEDDFMFEEEGEEEGERGGGEPPEPETAEQLALRELYLTPGRLPGRLMDPRIKVQAVGVGRCGVGRCGREADEQLAIRVDLTPGRLPGRLMDPQSRCRR